MYIVSEETLSKEPVSGVRDNEQCGREVRVICYCYRKVDGSNLSVVEKYLNFSPWFGRCNEI